MKLIIQTELEKDAILQELEGLTQEEKADHTISEEYGVSMNKRGNEYLLKIQKKKYYYNWLLYPQEKQLKVESELSLSVVSSLTKMGFCLMAIIFFWAIAVLMATRNQIVVMATCLAIGLVPLWLFAYMVVSDFMMPKRVVSSYLKKKFEKK